MSYHQIVKSLVRTCFDSNQVASFQVQETLGWEDDQFIRVTIVLNEEADNFDVKKAADFRRSLRSRLDEANGDAFPVVSFLSKSEEPQAA